MWVLIADLNDDGMSHGLEAFGPYPELQDARDEIEAVYRWAGAKGYRRDRHEVEVSISSLKSPAERSRPGKFQPEGAA